MTLFLLAVGAAVFLAAALSVLYGSMEITFGQVVNAVIRPDAADQQHIVVRELRIPRTLGCILAGAAFSAAGSLMQGVTRNPLADSGLLGINAGASFALALCLAFLPGLGFTGVVIFSFLGASVSMLAVYGLMSMRHRKLEPVRLVLAGSAVSIFLSSLSQAVSIFFQIGYDLTFWTAGGAQASAPGSFCWQARSLFPAWWQQSCCRGVFPCSAWERMPRKAWGWKWSVLVSFVFLLFCCLRAAPWPLPGRLPS